MSKKDEDSLESFFRKAVNQSDSSFMEQDWRAMERKLDENSVTSAVRTSRIRTRRVVIATTTLAVMISLYFFSLRKDQALVGEQGSTEKQAAANAVIPKQDNRSKENATADLLLPQPPNQAAVSPRTSPQRTSRRTQRAAQLNPVKGSEENSNPLAQASRVKPENPEAQEIEQNIFSDSRQSLSASGPIAKGEESPAAEEQHDESALHLLEEESVSTVLEERKDPKLAASSRWSFAISVAPDFSSTTLRHYTSPGSAIGLSVGYRFLNRFNLGIGVMKSAKRYEGYGNEYKPPYGYWKARTNGIVPDEVYGSCKILEIPLILQYDVIHGKRSRIYTGAGLSTYLMSDEAYQYRFYSPNPGADQGWSSEGDRSSYPMAIGHLSIGFERQLASKLSIGIEPFLKVPFAGIGWSDIKLYTTGAYVNLRYTISRPRSIVEYNNH